MIKRLKELKRKVKSRLEGGLVGITFYKDRTLVCIKDLQMRGERRLADLVEWMKSQKSNLRAFALRWNLSWYMYFIANCIIAVSATSFGFALGALLTVLVYDDGLERVMDVYNYFKRPPRS